MFGRTPKVVISRLEDCMMKILDEMDTFGPDSQEYPTMLDHLERVSNLHKSEDKRKATPDNLILVAGNLLGILVIVAYEQKHVMTSKGLGFVRKP